MTKKSTALVPLKPTAAAQRPANQAIVRGLTDILLRVPTLGTADLAALLADSKEIRSALQIIERDAAQRIIDIAPTEEYKYRGETFTRPVKEQPVEGVGIVAIERSADRNWITPLPELAHIILERHAAQNGGELPSPHSVVDLIFELFSVAYVRTSVLKEKGHGDLDQEPHVEKFYTSTARVK